MIKQATELDIPIIEDILLDAVHWMDSIGLHQWGEQQVSWDGLSQYYSIDDFYILYVDDAPAACASVIDYDPMFWDIPKGDSLYIHKLAVKREYAGQGYSTILINHAKDLARKRNINTVRLDCHQNRPKVRAIYEREGFVCVREFKLFDKYDTALYVCELE